MPETTICCDPGTENNHFKNLDLITSLHSIPGHIHVYSENPFENTQTVETSHSGVKMRLRLGRGLHRHHLQAWLDFEDFIFNRTDGSSQAVFKKLGNAASAYVSTVAVDAQRASRLCVDLKDDVIENIVGLTSEKIKLHKCV